MKRIVSMLAAAACSLALLTGCGNSVVGKWHCVKYSENGEKYTNSECKEDNGYGLSAYYEIEFEKDGTGTLYYRPKGRERKGSFEYESDGDEYSLEFTEGRVTGTASFDDGKLVLKLKEGGGKSVITFEEGESKEDYTAPSRTPTARMKSANSNAKLVFTTVSSACADAVSNGEFRKLKNLSYCGLVEDLPDEKDYKDIGYMVRAALEQNGNASGYVYWEVDTSKYKPAVAQWADEEEGIVGQYPDPESDPKAEHEVGRKF